MCPPPAQLGTGKGLQAGPQWLSLLGRVVKASLQLALRSAGVGLGGDPL